jgi:hypothetical protein
LLQKNKIVRAKILCWLWAAALLALPAAVRAQFTFVTNADNTITITGYTGSDGYVIIPNNIGGLPVARIGDNAFFYCTTMGSVTIPDSVTSIGNGAFNYCFALANVTMANSVTNIGNGTFTYCISLKSIVIPNSVTSIGDDVFGECSSLTSVTIPNSVTSIGSDAFARCSSLAEVIIPDSVTNIGDYTFDECYNLTSIRFPKSVTSMGMGVFYECSSLNEIFFYGDAPGSVGASLFNYTPSVTVYYLPGTTGWETTFSGQPTALWLPQIQTVSPIVGGQTNPFSFNINWASGQTVVVVACTNLFNPDWQPLQTNLLTTDSAGFSDAQWTNYPARYYRLRSQ